MMITLATNLKNKGSIQNSSQKIQEEEIPNNEKIDKISQHVFTLEQKNSTDLAKVPIEINGKNYEKLLEEIKTINEILGITEGNLHSMYPKRMEGQSDDTMLQEHYKSLLVTLQTASNQFLSMKPQFDSYFELLQNRILKDEEMDFTISPLLVKTIAYALKTLESQNIQTAVNHAKSKYLERKKRFEKLILDRLMIEEKLYSIMHQISIEIIGFTAPLFLQKVQDNLLLLQNNMFNLERISIPKVKEWFINYTFSKISESISGFVSSASHSRRTFRTMAKENASLPLPEITIHFNKIKALYLNFVKKVVSLYPLVLEMHDKVKQTVDEWEKESQIPDSQLHSFAIIRKQTIEELKSNTYKPFLQEHLEKKQLLVTLIYEINTFKKNFDAAANEVQRMYDCVKRNGSFVTESWFNANGWIDSDVKSAYLSIIEQPKKSESPT